ncbi:GNAT family N-acetyltransferase [Ideonella sp. DXS29W]|uniref:GNAT family N-acetyltransferase n=1 Tax=Ideonella lacteola TaxID=2984193 RepID=A0ABU9BX48_9BURK
MTLSPAAPALVVVQHHEKFPEPEFSQLSRRVFAQIQQPSTEWAQVMQAEAAALASVSRDEAAPVPPSPMRRWVAYWGDEWVGWSTGWMDRGQVFYMAHSGVLPEHRRRGIYSALLTAVCQYAQDQAAVAVRSQHSVLNNPVLVAKLRAGFHVTGLSHAAHMGTLVELTRHLSEGRQALFRTRSLPYVPPEA